jgi:AraC-like DNA-binding protein
VEGKAALSARNLDDVLQRIIRYGFTVYKDTDVFVWLNQTEQSQLADIFVVNTIRRYMVNEPLVYDIVLYNTRTDRVYSTLQGISERKAFKALSLLETVEQDSGLVRLKPYRHPVTGVDTLVFSLPVSLLPEKVFDGYMVMVVDASRLAQAVLPETQGSESLYVVDGAGRLMLGDVLDEHVPDRTGGMVFALDTTFERHVSLETQSWDVIGIIRASPLEGQGTTIRVLLLSSAASLAFMVSATLFSVRRHFRPFGSMVAQLQRRLGRTAVYGNGEAEILQKSINALLESLDASEAERVRLANALSTVKALSPMTEAPALHLVPHDKRSALLSSLSERIRLQLGDPMLSVDVLAADAGLSTNYLRSLFKDLNGVSLSDHIRNERMLKAARLLKETDWTVDRVMGETGYLNRSSFFRVFKAFYGVTPDQWRKDNRDA